MQNIFSKKSQQYIKEHLQKKRWKRVVTVLACVVVFCTTYALILPAITLTGDTFCGQEEHVHTDECYEKTLICTAGETAPSHTHTDACFETSSVLSCGQEESEEHTHEEACYTVESVLTCGQEEAAEVTHEHTDECYAKTLICEQEEHEHSLACYSDPSADVESSDSWVQYGLTGNWADDVVSVAKSQIGYEESTRNYLVTEDGTMKGITRYGQWYGDSYGDWDAMFVSFCLNYAGIPQSTVPYADSCAEWTTALSGAGLYRTAAAYTPSKGDIVFFDSDADGAADRVGIVTEVSENTSAFKSVEGDVNNRVQQISYSLGASEIVGYAELPANPNYVEPVEDE